MLRIDGVSAGYGLVPVLHQVEMSVAAGSITAVIGSNGAGKTTLMRVLAGLLPATTGRVWFDGQDITAMAPERRVALGLALVPEGRLVFADLTVAETLRVGAWTARARTGWAARAEGLLAQFPALARRRTTRAGLLSGGEQQMLAIARALMSRPRLLLLDEPGLGLAPAMAAEVLRAVQAIRDSGVTVLVVDQDVAATLAVADHASVLETGRVVLSGPAASLAQSPQVRSTFLGIAQSAGDLAGAECGDPEPAPC